MEHFGEAAGGRTVRARLRHGDSAPGRGHVAVGAALHRLRRAGARQQRRLLGSGGGVPRARRHLRAPLRAELEFRSRVEVGAAVALRSVDGEDGSLALWVTDGQLVSASAVVRPWP